MRDSVLEDVLIDQLLPRDLLAELTAEHRRLDQRLQQLEKRRALLPSEQYEVALLKKQKLLTKARIARLT